MPLTHRKVLLDTPKNEKFAGKSLSNILMVELYAGSARLSKACQQVGVRSIAVDKTTQRSQGTRIFTCDVTDPATAEHVRVFSNSRTGISGMGAFCAGLWNSIKGSREAQQELGKSWL